MTPNPETPEPGSDQLRPDQLRPDQLRPDPRGLVKPDEVLDCRGQRCPLPVIALARRINDLPVGTVVRVYATDPAAAGDIAAWCRLRDQGFLGTMQLGDGSAIDVRRLS